MLRSCSPTCIGCATCRPLTLEDEARIERALTHAGYPAPRRTLHVIPTPSANITDETGRCRQTMTCECPACERDRTTRRPQGHGNADPFRRAA